MVFMCVCFFFCGVGVEIALVVVAVGDGAPVGVCVRVCVCFFLCCAWEHAVVGAKVSCSCVFDRPVFVLRTQVVIFSTT